MRATFGNRLKVEEESLGNQIRYEHPFRVDVTVAIVHAAPKNDNGLRNWDVSLKSKNDALLQKVRDELVRDLYRYIARRMKNRAVSKIGFEEIQSLALALSVQ